MSSETTSTSSSGKQRRVGRVERWLRKGYGFIVDLGRLEADDGRYGWVKDDLSGGKAFVYHNALKSDTENVFHRLFANEYVEFTVDLDRPQRDGRIQAFDVTGLQGGELLCDLNAAAAAAAAGEDGDGSSTPSNTPATRSRRSHTVGVGQPSFGAPPAGATVVYYVPVPGGGAPAGAPASATAAVPQPFPPMAAPTSTATEPSYVMPASGIPVPK